MRNREPRRKVLVPARMRVGAAWSDAAILNISSRGMLMRSSSAPPQGTYLEIRRGPHVVVARVVWSNTDRFGIRTQDPVCPDRLMKPTAPGDGPQPADRRARPRIADRADANRRRGRGLQFIIAAICGAGAALIVGDLAYGALSAPFDRVGAAFAAR